MSGYAYTRSRKINFTTILLVVALAAGVYLGFKFIPVYWQRYKVDEILTDIAFGAIDLRLSNPDVRYDQEQKLLAKARERITALGIDGETLTIYFADDMSSVNADYSVVVNLPVLEPTVLDFKRSVNVPGDNRVP